MQREAEAPWFDLGIVIYQVAIGEEREGVIGQCLYVYFTWLKIQ